MQVDSVPAEPQRKPVPSKAHVYGSSISTSHTVTCSELGAGGPCLWNLPISFSSPLRSVRPPTPGPWAHIAPGSSCCSQDKPLVPEAAECPHIRSGHLSCFFPALHSPTAPCGPHVLPVPGAWPPCHRQSPLSTLSGPSMGQVPTPSALETVSPPGRWGPFSVPFAPGHISGRTLMPLEDPEFPFCLTSHQALKVSGLDISSLNP